MIRALICDIYGTLLEMGPPPPQADTRWANLWAECVGPTPAPSLQTFEAAVRPFIARHHTQERARGLVQPEVDWPALATARLTIDLFTPDLCFFSFEHGIAKPDPHVFHWLNSRLAARGIAPKMAVMVGDRPDNDVAPAKAAGWQTWLLGPTACPESGDWTALHHWLLRA